ncbi:MAG: protein-export chaperone SecB [Ignavibacteriae bacterium]|nr:protein-export chaperone SecB [Ignavibacteriota bacterium]
MENNQDSKIVVKDISLIESYFKKEAIVLTKEMLNNDIKLSLNVLQGEPIFSVTLNLDFNSKQADKDVSNAKISIMGIFEIEGSKPSYYDNFCYVNAPAIIYPYIREHLATLSLKAGVPPVNLPPFNFVAFGQGYLDLLKASIEKV